jgi:hypothetical protein
MKEKTRLELKSIGLVLIITIIVVIATSLFSAMFLSCSGNTVAELNRAREAETARLQSEYAIVVNKLEMKEGNFKTYRRVTFYNVRLGEVVFVCEGHCHVQIDKDGDVEIVVKDGEDKYLRHYLGQKTDITYFSEQLTPNDNVEAHRYKVMWNPKLWIPVFDSNME